MVRHILNIIISIRYHYFFRHPDKTNHPEAADKFVEIKQAYELLSDPERRLKYDQKGIITEDGFKGKDYDYARFHTNPFDELFSYGHHFNFQENDITFFHKFSITTRYLYVVAITTNKINLNLF